MSNPNMCYFSFKCNTRYRRIGANIENTLGECVCRDVAGWVWCTVWLTQIDNQVDFLVKLFDSRCQGWWSDVPGWAVSTQLRTVVQIMICMEHHSFNQSGDPINPLSPHDASKHHFTSLDRDLIFLRQEVSERNFSWNWFTNTWQFSIIFKPHQVIFIHYKSRIATQIRGL